MLWFPWRIVVEPGRFDGWNASPGGLILALGIPGLFAGGRRARVLGLYCLAGVVFFFFFQHFARYMLPFFVVMMPVAALAVCRFTRLRWLTYSVTIATFASGLVLGFGMNHFKIPVAAGLESADLSDTLSSGYAAFQLVNRECRDGQGRLRRPSVARPPIERFTNGSVEILRKRGERPLKRLLGWSLPWIRGRTISRSLRSRVTRPWSLLWDALLRHSFAGLRTATYTTCCIRLSMLKGLPTLRHPGCSRCSTSGAATPTCSSW